MKFRTSIKLQTAKNQLDYGSKIVLFGSCFSENISKKLSYFKFPTYSNPFGILFNPLSIETIISNSIQQKKYTEEDLFFLNEQWHCFDAHSDLSASDKTVLLNNLNNAVKHTKAQLINASHIIITLGTAWVYKLKSTNQLVGNCHKVPQNKFTKELATVEEISNSLKSCINQIKQLNNKATIIFTVSPVRHLKDGFVENSRSKAHLLTAIHQIIEKTTEINYFPSFEIMLDDLRDYRFYSEDMFHPNETAINYIWETFKETWITNNTIQTMKEVEIIQKGLAHRPFNPTSKQHKEFLENLSLKIKQLKTNYNISF